MSNFTKTFKSEYHFGGKCTIQKMGTIILCTFGDDQLVWRENINNGGHVARIHQFLEFNTSSYYAEKIINYLKEKLS